MTVGEVAVYLRIPRSSAYKLARDRVIPSQKVGRHWRFHRSAIDLWLSEYEGKATDHTSARGAGKRD